MPVKQELKESLDMESKPQRSTFTRTSLEWTNPRQIMFLLLNSFSILAVLLL